MAPHRHTYETARGMVNTLERGTDAAIVSRTAYTMNPRCQRTHLSQTGTAFSAVSNTDGASGMRVSPVGSNSALNTSVINHEQKWLTAFRSKKKKSTKLALTRMGIPFKNDTERLEKLFEMYTKMTTKPKARA